MIHRLLETTKSDMEGVIFSCYFTICSHMQQIVTESPFNI